MISWKQGEHIAIIGATGSGKTTLARTLLKLRQYSLMLVTKPDDLYWTGWKKIEHDSQINTRHKRYRLWPRFEHQWREFNQTFKRVWEEGGWCLYVDELYYIQKVLGMEAEAVKLLTQGRSKHISVVVGVQRPSWVTRFAFSEPRHIISFRLGDKRDLKTLREGVDVEFAEIVPTLKEFEFVYYNKVSHLIERGNARELARQIANET